MVTHSEKTTGLRIGYARVSTHEQSLDSQVDPLKQAGCQRIYCDKVSGTKAERPELDRLRESLRSGDTLVLWRLDRLGRSMHDLINWVEWLEKAGISLHSLNEQIDTSHHTGKLVFHLFAALAEFEHNLIGERTCAPHATSASVHCSKPFATRVAPSNSNKLTPCSCNLTGDANTMHPHRKTQYRNMQTNELDSALRYIRKHIYEDMDEAFQGDQRMLLYALTWPAAWLDSRALRMHRQDYQRMLMDKIVQITRHGDPER